MKLYLIMHKVRGEVAWDVAESVMIGDEDGWIVPSSGHRAYPYRHWELEDLADISDINRDGFHTKPAFTIADGEAWKALEDHYQIIQAPPRPASFGHSLLEKFGLVAKEKRRA